jgi:hypothetical protein
MLSNWETQYLLFRKCVPVGRRIGSLQKISVFLRGRGLNTVNTLLTTPISSIVDVFWKKPLLIEA